MDIKDRAKRMLMRIAIHYIEGVPGGFNSGWIGACKELGCEVKLVNAYDSDIMDQLRDCDAFMWHWNPADNLFAKQLIASIESMGIPVFPDVHTCWHFDDKVGQKYLFEALGIPAAKAWVFYDKNAALEWAADTSWPKVFKLRGGAGAVNVKLLHSFREAKRQIGIMFGKGCPPATAFSDFKTKFRKHKRNGSLLQTAFRTLPSAIWRLINRKRAGNDRGYVYFQEFIPDNSFDIRVVVVGDKAFAIRRNCRPGDFRASGSGEIQYAKDLIPIECVRIAFKAAKKMKMQSAAFDFVKAGGSQWQIVEVSYGYSPRAYDDCDGFWTDDLVWHDERVLFEKWMVEMIVKCSNANIVRG